MRSNILVIGLGRFGTAAARELSSLGYEVMAVDIDEGAVNDVAPDVTSAVQLDATDERALRSIGAGEFDFAIVSVSEAIDVSVFATVAVKRMGVGTVIAKAGSDVHGEILRRVGADRVIFAEQERGVNLAHALGIEGSIEYLDVAPRFGIVKLVPPAGVVGATVGSLDLGRDGTVSLVAVRRGSDVTVHPSPSMVIEASDDLIVMGPDDQLEAFARRR
jgi:trk system potassium uptake protein TrkA